MTGDGGTERAKAARHVVVMGVSGCGKTTVAEGIAASLGRAFADADGFHPPENVAKMRAGIPLDDSDRWPWLRALAAWMSEQADEGRSTVMACSALRRAYRDVLRSAPPGVVFVHLHGPAEVIESRMSSRAGHFMPSALLASQLSTLEPLAADEPGVVLDLRDEPESLVRQALAWLDER